MPTPLLSEASTCNITRANYYVSLSGQKRAKHLWEVFGRMRKIAIHLHYKLSARFQGVGSSR